MSPKSTSKPHYVQRARNVTEESDAFWTLPSQDLAVWDAPLEEDPPLTREEVNRWEHQCHVERVADMVPYWIKSVTAAANGEELRLEPFLNTLQDVSQSWMTSDNPWGKASGAAAWGISGEAGRWEVHPEQSVSSSGRGSKTQTGSRPRTAASGGSVMRRAEKRNGGRSGNNVDNQETAYAFVEDIARHEAADAERKRRMHQFFEMPTDEKVQKITEIVRYLKSSA